ncbi:MAG TPA: phosphoribosylamine--glycine ligase, partial [Chitinophagales bacterium]|nr:phosphoribosylamine--glycine ligase [Chitinophagales bacterium]
LYTAPGNPGTAQHGTNVPLPLNDFEKLTDFIRDTKIELVVCGPEEPLVKGLEDYVNELEGLDVKFVGPSMQGALLEGSKAYAKEFMQRHAIPTARYQKFDAAQFHQAVAFANSFTGQIVIKADGLAAGKGVVICQTKEEATATLDEMLNQQKFGAASANVVIEEFLAGIEMSAFCITDGTHYLMLPTAKDYKRIGEKDTGPNTGGMGAVSPVPFANSDLMDKIENRVVIPTVVGLKKENIRYRGFIYFGLMIVDNEPFVIEYNCRLGDPETQVLMPRIENDLVELCLALFNDRLDEMQIQTRDGFAVGVVVASGGYPGDIKKGLTITNADAVENGWLFHAGTAKHGNDLVTNGGRVFTAVAEGSSVAAARDKALRIASGVSFDGKYVRRDIGYEFV